MPCAELAQLCPAKNQPWVDSYSCPPLHGRSLLDGDSVSRRAPWPEGPQPARAPYHDRASYGSCWRVRHEPDSSHAPPADVRRAIQPGPRTAAGNAGVQRLHILQPDQGGSPRTTPLCDARQEPGVPHGSRPAAARTLLTPFPYADVRRCRVLTPVCVWRAQRTENAVDSVVKRATKVGNHGGSIAVKAMKSIRDHPCESSPAPGCVTP